MLGTIGFSIGALTIGLFAGTSYRAHRYTAPRQLQLFCSAFGLFAAAMVLWAICTATNNPVATPRLLFASDTLLLGGTLCMALYLVNFSSIVINVVFGVIAALALSLRAFSFPPTGYVQNGLLYFNLSGSVRTVILLAFVLVWLPVMVQQAYNATRDATLVGLRNLMISNFVALVLVADLFLSARRSGVIIGLFSLITALFLIMSVLNIAIIKLHAIEPIKLTPLKRKARS